MDCWGADKNDLICDKVEPKLIRMLDLCLDVIAESGNSTDGELNTELNIIDVKDRLIDALAACRHYEKLREAEIEKEDMK